jgi:hypothetical protein
MYRAIFSILPTRLFRHDARDANRKRAMTRQDNAARPRWILEYIMGATVTDAPTFAHQACRNFAAISFWSRHLCVYICA